MKPVKRVTITLALGLASLPAAAPAEAGREPPIKVSEIAPNRLELIYSSDKFTSRDAVDGYMLLKAAQLAKAHGEQWFVLLALPGERSDAHPPRRAARFGEKYGHWQPHWNYYVTTDGWQWWHPEWGAAFWTEEIDMKRVEKFEAHAMIELGQGGDPFDPALAFNTQSVIDDLGNGLQEWLTGRAH